MLKMKGKGYLTHEYSPGRGVPSNRKESGRSTPESEFNQSSVVK